MKNLIILILIICYPKFSFSNEIFKTEFFNIEFISDNVEVMKNKKISEIKKISIESIYKRILLKKDYDNIKKNLNEDQINTFIKNIIIENEKIINNSYSSNIKINFDINTIVKELRFKKIPYIEYEPQEFLTIIYEKNNLNKNLLTNQNTYYDFLIKNNDMYSFFKIPNLDINDRYLLNIQDIEKEKNERLKLFINKYSNLETILIKSQKLDTEKKYEIFFYDYENNNFEMLKTLSTNRDYSYVFNIIKNDVIDKWKEKNSIQNKKLMNINCDVLYFNLLELKEIINKINNITFIENIKLNIISYKKNNYTIDFFGNNKILMESFKKNSLLINEKNENCIVKLK